MNQIVIELFQHIKNVEDNTKQTFCNGVDKILQFCPPRINQNKFIYGNLFENLLQEYIFNTEEFVYCSGDNQYIDDFVYKDIYGISIKLQKSFNGSVILMNHRTNQNKNIQTNTFENKILIVYVIEQNKFYIINLQEVPEQYYQNKEAQYILKFKQYISDQSDYKFVHYNKKINDIVINPINDFNAFIYQNFKAFVHQNTMKFHLIELFGGIGTFSQSLKEYFNINVIAYCDIDKKCQQSYQQNHQIENNQIINDVRTFEQSFEEKDLKIQRPLFVTAGFPCQSFSNAGNRNRMNDNRGMLMNDMIRIINKYKPEYIVLENVASFYNNGTTEEYKKLVTDLSDYDITARIISPKNINLPQDRQRVFIVGILKIANHINETWISKLNTYIDEQIEKSRISNQNFTNTIKKCDQTTPNNDIQQVLNIWDKILQLRLNKKFPLNTYLQYAGDERFNQHIKTNYTDKSKTVPSYIQQYRQTTQQVYNENPELMEKYIQQLEQFNQQKYLKFEYQVEDKTVTNNTSLKNNLIHLRNQQIRVKDTNNYPTITKSDANFIVYKNKKWRDLHIDEYKRIQGFPQNYNLHENKNEAKGQLGNAINLQVLNCVSKSLKQLIINDILQNQQQSV